MDPFTRQKSHFSFSLNVVCICMPFVGRLILLESTHLIGYSPIIQGIVGNYGLFENCIFQRNQAATFGGAIAIYSLIVLDHRERIKPIDISNWYVYV